MERPTFGIYVHWPFCMRKCPYCGFNSYAFRESLSEPMVGAIFADLEKKEPFYEQRNLVSVYFGGGTPSLMEAAQVGRILERISKRHSLDGVEITLETNPKTASLEKLKAFRQAGVNRLSIGAQSFQDRVLSFLGRLHNADEAEQCFLDAREAGFASLGVDLILGSRASSPELLRRDLDKVAELQPEGVSAYMLSIEDRTPFKQRAEAGEELSLPEDDVCAQYETTLSFLDSIGLKQYEISNFAKAGFEAVHNSLYWAGDEYMGLGPGAHGFFYRQPYREAVRYENRRDPARYAEDAASDADSLDFQETLDVERSRFAAVIALGNP